MKIKDLFETTQSNSQIERNVWSICKKLETNEKQIRPAQLMSKLLLNGRIANGYVNLSTNKRLDILDEMLDDNGELIIPLGQTGAVWNRSVKLTSFKNFPQEINVQDDTGIFFAKSHNTIKSWDGITKRIMAGGLDCAVLDNIPSLSNFDKHFEVFNGPLTINTNYKGPILSVLKLSGISALEIEAGGVDAPEKSSDQFNVMQIINKHIKNGKDIFECKEELINAGLKEYAKL